MHESTQGYMFDIGDTVKVISFRQDMWTYKFVSDENGSADAEKPDWLKITVGSDNKSLIVETIKQNNEQSVRKAYVKFYYQEDSEEDKEGPVLTIQQLQTGNVGDAEAPINVNWVFEEPTWSLVCDGKSDITFVGTGTIANWPPNTDRLNVSLDLPSIKVSAPWNNTTGKFTFANSVNIKLSNGDSAEGPTYVRPMLYEGIVSLGAIKTTSVDTTYTINIKVTSTEYPNTDIYEGYEKILLEIVT